MFVWIPEILLRQGVLHIHIISSPTTLKSTAKESGASRSGRRFNALLDNVWVFNKGHVLDLNQ